MITNNVIQRVFYIKFGTSTGTGFTIDIDNRQYFVTAKHVVAGLKDGGTIEIFHDNHWVKSVVRLVGHSNVSDVSVFVSTDMLLGAHPLPATTAGMVYGQDMYFLGFPYGFHMDSGTFNGNFPIPLVKKATASTLAAGANQHFLLDGHNNPGFSGGPVVFCAPGSTEFRVAGIIHGYHPEYNIVAGQRQGIPNTNSGIILAYTINNAIDLITANPIGHPLQY